MNTHIKQLAEQAGFYFYDLHNVDGQDLGETVEADSWSAVEKFAELIVKECATRIESQAQELRKLCRNEVSWANKELYEERIETCDDLVWQINKVFESK